VTRTAPLLIVVATACQVDVGTSSSALVDGTADTAHASVVAIVGRRASCDAPEKLACSGTLLGPRAVLTAAHCLDAVEPQELEVIVTNDLHGSGAVLAVWDAIVHPAYDPFGAPAQANDLALLVLEPGASIAPSTIAMSAPVAGTTARYVGFGSTSPYSSSGLRLAADARIDTVDDGALWTSDGGVPCGGDSGGALFVDTPGGEVLAGVVKGSAQDCTRPGVATRVDVAHDFITAALATANAMAESGRPVLDATADFCTASCASHDDCALGMLCLNERGRMHCGYRDGRTTLFGEQCTTGDDCVPIGQGTARECRTRVDCGESSGGCQTSSDAGGGMLLVLIVLLWLYALRGRAMPY
jgi:uncharacterized protein (TIGR03382 family)